ncbi:MAG: hypothetical protein QXN63_03040 [Candidatus Bathyarchaeia archaeon]
MGSVKFVQDELWEKEWHFLAVYLETKNACLVLLSEAEDRLGTLAIALPQTAERTSLSSVLLGERNVTTARILAERLSLKTGKIALVSVFIKSINETEASPFLFRLFEKITQKTAEKEKIGT